MLPVEVIPSDAWKATHPLFICREDCRSPEHLMQAVKQFDVANQARYKPRGGATFCNIFVWDVTSAMCAEVPHWISKQDGSKCELNANDSIDWLKNQGPAMGWASCDEPIARSRSNAGCPVILAWQNPRRALPGHVAIALPSPLDGPLFIAQAGIRCFVGEPVARGFGPYKPLYFVHD